jgi:hypothetical protein
LGCPYFTYYGNTSFFVLTSKPLPGKRNPAELLTDKIQEAINQKAWDSTTAVSFTFMETTIIYGIKKAI